MASARTPNIRWQNAPRPPVAAAPAYPGFPKASYRVGRNPPNSKRAVPRRVTSRAPEGEGPDSKQLLSLFSLCYLLYLSH